MSLLSFSSFPASNPFLVSFNGTMPSASTDAFPAAYTGPSVESVGGSKPAISGGKLGAVIGVPLLAVAVLVAIYVLWQKKKRAPQKKRWSAVIDNRLSMISSGTVPPPRFSMYSHHSHSASSSGQPRPSLSQSTRSHATSAYSPRPTSQHSPQHTSRLSFADAPRPTNERRQSGLRNSVALVSKPSVRHSVAGVLTTAAVGDENHRGHGHSWSTSALPRSRSTQEHLASPRQRNSPSKLRNATNRASAVSMSGELQNMTAVKIVRDPSLAYELAKSASEKSGSTIDEKAELYEAEDGPFADPVEAGDATDMQTRYEAAACLEQLNHMRLASLSSITPDDALQRYAAASTTPADQATSSPQTPSRRARFRGMIRSISRTISPTRSASSHTILQTPPMSPESVFASQSPVTTNKDLPQCPSATTLAKLAEEEVQQLELEKQRRALSAMSFAASPPPAVGNERRRSTYEDQRDDFEDESPVFEEKGIFPDEKGFGMAI